MDISKLTHKVVTFRTVTGEEIIGKLEEYNSKNGLFTVSFPRVVLLDENGEVMTVQYSLTGNNDQVIFHNRNVFSVTESDEIAAQDYVIQNETQNINSEVIMDFG
jgi:hypothetical protein